MEYKVTVYSKGLPILKTKTTAQNHKSAAKITEKSKSFDLVVVEGETTKRFSKDYQEITVAPMLFKIYHENVGWSILAMFDNLAEVFGYKTKDERDEAFSKCTISTSVESAKAEEEQTDITVSSDGTGDLENGLMSRKTWNGYVTSATWQDSLIHENIGNSSGKLKLDDMVESAWSGGSTHYPSKPVQTFLGTIKKLPRDAGWPGVNTSMRAMQFHSYKVQKNESYCVANGWAFHKSWIDGNFIKAKIMPMPKGTTKKANNGTRIRYDVRQQNKVVWLSACGCGCGCYVYSGSYYLPDWLDVNTKEEAERVPPYVKTVIMGVK